MHTELRDHAVVEFQYGGIFHYHENPVRIGVRLSKFATYTVIYQEI